LKAMVSSFAIASAHVTALVCAIVCAIVIAIERVTGQPGVPPQGGAWLFPSNGSADSAEPHLRRG
jgi:hypothetical protein